MNAPKIDVGKVTRPFQFLAAGLVGLIAIDWIFLSAAAKISNPTWASSALVIAAIAFIPGYILCVILLMTKFRHLLQDDSHYLKYLLKVLPLINAPGTIAAPKDINALKDAAANAAAEVKKLANKNSNDD
jgi:hypothetical protein